MAAKKVHEAPAAVRKRLINENDSSFSVCRQCELLGVNRSNLYYKVAGEKEQNLELMRLLDKQYTDTPYYGSRKMTAWLNRQGYQVNRKRVRRLMQTMDLETIYQKPDTSPANPENKVYSYLLRDLEITHCNHVWSNDITYISPDYS